MGILKKFELSNKKLIVIALLMSIIDSFKNFVDLKFFDEIGLEFLILSKNS
ncbi:MAG: hypothetical protein ACI388_00510 [Methanobrevibacter sp.]|uniref:hypothetical protein n=1 Tax=Methanobrevibacter sp. TaxID=66852 RepID=UPI003F073221